MSKYLGKDRLPIGQENVETLSGRWLPAAAGIDIHKHTLTATVLIPDFTTQTITKHAQKFSTDYNALRELRDWLNSFKPYGLTRYGIEATSTYYRPVEYALQGHLEQVLINPFLLKERRKTDAKDSYTIAYTVLTGLFQPTLPTPDIQQQLKTLNRRLRKATERRTAASNAIETTLTNYNILIGQHLRMLSASGRAIIEAIISGASTPEKAAEAATYYSQSSLEERQKKYLEILTSLSHLPDFPEAARFTIRQLYSTALFFDEQITAYRQEIDQLLTTFKAITPDGEILITAQEAYDLLLTIPGANQHFALTFIAECGLDMRRYPSAAHLVSYCGFNPEKRVSADKVTSASSLPGNKVMHAITTQIAQALLQTSKTNPLAIWGRQYRTRNGSSAGAHNMAVAAVARRLINATWYILTKKEPYRDDNYDFTVSEKNAQREVKRLLRHANEVSNTVNRNDINPATRAQALAIMSSVAALIGADFSHLRIVPGRPDCPITDLNLPSRVTTTLAKRDMTKVSQLVFAWASQTLADTPGIGETSLNLIIESLLTHNYLSKEVKS